MLSLYIHIPFCVSKCRYCGFYSTFYSQKSADEFIAALRKEAVLHKSWFAHLNFETLYIGGGTPSILSLEQVSGIMDIIAEHFTMSVDAECTIEANPNSLDAQKLALWKQRGINRLSLGVQSFSDDVLAVLGRSHTAGQAHEAFMLARSAGFENIGLDLIYGIPGQTFSQWEATLDAAIRLKPEHVSAYNLSLDKGSQYSRDAESGRFVLPDDDAVAGMYELALQKLHNAGYARYEISNFSLPGFECRHNLNYWERGEYLGLGPGAWSFINGRRYGTVADISEYAKRLSSNESVVDFEETVGAEAAASEAVLLGLRTMRGLDLRGFELTYGQEQLRHLEEHAAPLKEAGLLFVTEGRMRLTDRGILLSDEALARLSG